MMTAVEATLEALKAIGPFAVGVGTLIQTFRIHKLTNSALSKVQSDLVMANQRVAELQKALSKIAAGGGGIRKPVPIANLDDFS